MPKGNFSTECVEGLPLNADVALRRSTCKSWTDLFDRPRPFHEVLAYLHWSGKRLALAAERSDDIPKVDLMRDYISKNWHPDIYLTNIPCVNLEKPIFSLDEIKNGKVDPEDVFRRKSELPCENMFDIPNPGILPSFKNLTHPKIFTAKELQSYLDSERYGSDGLLYGAVVFSAIGGSGSIGSAGSWEYSIRLNVTSQTAPFTKRPTTRPLDLGLQMREADAYLRKGFMSVQLLLDRYIIGNRTETANASQLLQANGIKTFPFENESVREILAEPLRYAPQSLETVPMPVTGVVIDGFYQLIARVFPLVFIVGFLYTQKSIINELITEKETKVRESLRMLGVGSMAIFGSWYATYGLIFSVICGVFTACAGLSIFPTSSGTLVFIFFWFWSISFLSFALFVHSFFNQARTGGIVGIILMFLQWIIYAAQNKGDDPASPGVMLALMLMPNAAFCAGLDMLSKYEASKVGASWLKLWWPVRNSSFGMVLVMMCLDTLLWTFAGWYLDRVLPKEFGSRLPLNFLCMPSYWMGHPGSSQSMEDQIGDSDVPARCAAPDTVEAVPEAVRLRSHASGAFVRTVGLRREFSTPGGTKVAVAGLDLTMYEGQVLACLGHNGAGKSTTINMLTGMVAPSAGDAFVAGYSVLTDMREIRKIIGVCPQHDVLWLELTVIEHLYIYARIRGVPPTDVHARAYEMMQAVGLTEKANTRGGSLSGGQKRKLSLCLALIGKPCVVFLDEPTSGMDPFSRRSTWNIIRGAREGRVTVLTTHFMDEADILGDRIAIMAEGELQCCGSALFLKNRFGAGYRITCARQKGIPARPAGGDSVADVVMRHVPQAEVLTDVGAELSMRLPTSAAARFPNLFDELDSSLGKLGLEQYGLSMVTLEEVFLCIASGMISRLDRQLSGGSIKEAYGLGDSNGNAPAVADDSTTAQNYIETEAVSPSADQGTSAREHAEGVNQGEARVVARHLASLFMKRARYGRRDFKSLVCMVLLPVAWLAFGLWLLMKITDSHFPLTVLSMEAQYGPQRAVPFNSSGTDDIRIDTAMVGAKPRVESIPTDLGNGFYFGRQYTNGTPSIVPCEANKCLREEYICKHIWGSITALQTVGLGFDCDTNASGAVAEVDYFCANDAHRCVVLCIFRGRGAAGGISKKACQEQCEMACKQIEPLEKIMFPLLLNSSKKISFLCPLHCADASDPDTCNPGTSCHSANRHHVIDPQGTLGFELQLYQDGQGSDRESACLGAVKTVSEDKIGTAVTLLFNTSGVHIVPTMLNLVSTSLKRAISGDGSSISVSNYPMPLNANSDVSQVVKAIVNFFASLVIIQSFSFIPGAIVAYIVREREAHHNSKHQQLISGVSLIAYWTANYLWDLCVYMAPLGLSLLVILALDLNVFIDNGALWATTVIFFGYGLAITPFSYLLSFLFSKHTTAQVICLVANFMTGLLLVMVSYILSAIDNTRDTNATLMWVFRFFPGFSLGHGILQVCTNSIAASFLSKFVEIDLLSWDISGKDVMYLYATAPLYFGLTVAVDYLLHSPMAAWGRHLDPHVDNLTEDEDEDVKAEVLRVANGEADGDMIRLCNLQKVYRTPEGTPKFAVRGLSFGLPRGECFGFLGINGAGKTSTLNMLTGAILPSGGCAYLGGFDVVKEQWKVRRLLGYCPQHDALLDRLTVREHLQLFGRIKGIKPSELRNYCDAMMHELDLQSHVHKQAMTLSGGNKRKLSLAISMMGSPPLVFLDEPSTGVDPAARRLMWNVIADVTTVKNKCSVMLTTHNMEEAEALCTRIGIMVGGRLQCIGSNQHLKSRFSNGYQMEARLQCPGSVEVTAAVADWQLPELVAANEVAQFCERLGRAERVNLVQEGCEEGYLIYEALVRSGSVTGRTFAEWWLLEDRAVRMGEFLQRRFPGTVALERHDRTLRFRLPAACRLAEVFRCLESERAGLSLEDYGISQTSLEQIFNEFASRQQEETGPVQGLFVVGRTVSAASATGSVEMAPNTDHSEP